MRKTTLLPDSHWDARQYLNQQSSYPRLLFKYRRATLEHLEPLLLSSTFYLSARDQFNDPFDARCVVTVNGGLAARQARLAAMTSNVKATGRPTNLGMRHRSQLQRDMLDPGRAQKRAQSAYDRNANDYGIYSMAETPRSLLMWAHYAESHTGVCIGFYVPSDPDVFSHALPVQYRDSYPAMEWTKFEEVNAIESLLTKSKEWEYEQESRILLAHKARNVLPFGHESLVTVILGARCSEESERLVLALLERRKAAGRPVPLLMRSHLAPQKFSVGIFPAGKRPPAGWEGRGPSKRRRLRYAEEGAR